MMTIVTFYDLKPDSLREDGKEEEDLGMVKPERDVSGSYSFALSLSLLSSVFFAACSIFR